MRHNNKFLGRSYNVEGIQRMVSKCLATQSTSPLGV
jgi:hypothetical protein